MCGTGSLSRALYSFCSLHVCRQSMFATVYGTGSGCMHPSSMRMRQSRTEQCRPCWWTFGSSGVPYWLGLLHATRLHRSTPGIMRGGRQRFIQVGQVETFRHGWHADEISRSSSSQSTSGPLRTIHLQQPTMAMHMQTRCVPGPATTAALSLALSSSMLCPLPAALWQQPVLPVPAGVLCAELQQDSGRHWLNI